MIEKRIKNKATLKRYKRFKKHRLAVFCVIFFVILTGLSFTAPFWANSKPIVFELNGKKYYPIVYNYHPEDLGIDDILYIDYRELVKEKNLWAIWPLIEWDPFESNVNVDYFPSPPTATNLLGTDDRGRDILSRLIYGFKNSIFYAVSVWILCFSIGIFFGSMMGYWGGSVDFWGQRIVEILSTVPQFFLLIIIISIFQPNLTILVIISSLFGWISISYYVRGEFLKNRKIEFVESARAVGASTWRILFKHILPNSLGPVITFSPFVISGNIVALASLDYLGFGLSAPTPSWGELLNQGHQNAMIAPWLAIFPSVALFLTLTMLGIIGDAVRNAMDPKAT